MYVPFESVEILSFRHLIEALLSYGMLFLFTPFSEL
jgi:hypothetical protein